MRRRSFRQKTLLHSGNIVYEFSDLDEEDKKFWRDVFRKRNEELRLKEENKKEQDKIWKKNNPRDSKLSEDIRKLFNDFSINDEFIYAFGGFYGSTE